MIDEYVMFGNYSRKEPLEVKKEKENIRSQIRRRKQESGGVTMDDNNITCLTSKKYLLVPDD